MLQECADQFTDKDPEASTECKRLIAAREKDLGFSTTGNSAAGRYTMDVTSISVNGGEYRSGFNVDPPTLSCVKQDP